MRRALSVVLLTVWGAAAAPAPPSPPAGGSITIAPGVRMPLVSNGYSPREASNATTRALETWFRLGGRGVDTAYEYPNQPWVGEAVRAAASTVPREEIFVITKIKCTGSAETALALVQDDLKLLQLPYVDLVIIHGPGAVDPQSGGSRRCDGYKPCCQSLADIQATYHGLELAFARNLTRSIGVSNFQTKQLTAVVGAATVPPAVNQMQFYAGCDTAWCETNNATIAFGRAHGITFQAYSPLGHGSVVKNAAVQRVAEAHNITPAQAGLAWVTQQGFALVTSSDSEVYDREDLALGNVRLTDSEMRQLSGA